MNLIIAISLLIGIVGNVDLIAIKNFDDVVESDLNKVYQIAKAETTISVDVTTAPTYGAAKPNTTVCYELVGCFDNNPPFNNAAFYLPVAPEVIQTGFYLYTSTNELYDNISYTNETTLRSSNFNPAFPVKIIIHGFQNHGFYPWVIDMAKSILKREKGKANVVAVDWGIGAVFPLYFNASANTRLVARQTCLMMKLIRKVFYQNNWSSSLNIHCIGHSLGAHTCGQASASCDNAFNRVTAMDPAGPNFEGYDDITRVDKLDAKFVDVIHSNGDNLLTGNFGMATAVGHVDFYPNGGKQQPGCPSLISLIGGLFSNASAAASEVSCHHARAIYYFTESINSPCTFLGYPCSDQASFERGSCVDCGSEGCAQMGYFASTKSRGVKYLMTLPKDPYCAYPYAVEITISQSSIKTAGEISFILKYDDNENVTAPLTKTTDDLNPNEVYRKVFVSKIDIIDVDDIFIQFKKKPKPLFGTDPNAPELIIEKIRLLIVETDEVYSECIKSLKIADKEMAPININLNDCVVNKAVRSRAILRKFLRR